MNTVDIGALSKASGVPASTLRYYEQLGLIRSVGRNGLRRQFAEETLLHLTLIAMGKAAGFSLQEIGAIFDKNHHPQLPRARLRRRADELDRQIHRLMTLSKTLRHVADCPEPCPLDCPRFRKLLRLVCPALPQGD